MRKRKLPGKVILIGRTASAKFPFGTHDEGWRYVLDMTDGDQSWLPVRVGSDLHLINVERVQWGTA